MSKLTRFAAKIFGSAAGLDQIAQFGSLAAGSPAFTTDPATAQSLSNWLTGWFGAVIGGNAPAIEDMNSAFFVLSYQIAYAMQSGVPEWDSGTTYYIGSFVNSGGVIYCSLTDNNLNNLVSDTANWIIVAGQIMTALGDLVYGGTNGAATRLSGNTASTRSMLTQTGNGSGSSAAPVWGEIKAPDIQVLSGSGTYTKPAGALYLKVRLIGAGAGGAGGGGTGATAGGNGTDTTFGSSLLIAGHGTGGQPISGSLTPPAGGSVTVNSPAIRLAAITGGGGSSPVANGTTVSPVGAPGGNSAFGGAGGGGTNTSAGSDAASGSGSGGGGGGGASVNSAGGSGSSGGYVEALIPTPAASYIFSCGVGGSGGNPGTGGSAGGKGGDGTLIIEAHFQ